VGVAVWADCQNEQRDAVAAESRMRNGSGFKLAQSVFVVSCLALVFSYGVIVGHYQVFPFNALAFARESLVQVVGERETLLGTRPTEFLNPSRYPGVGVTKNLADRVAPGLILIYGFFEGGNEIRLIRNDGSIVNRWPIRYYDLFPDTDFIQPTSIVPRTDWNATVHGALPLPDGSIVFNFNYLGTAKLDRCGQVQWTLPRMTHHAVSRSADGTLLIPSSYHRPDKSKYETLHPPYTEDTILRVTTDGKVLSETSILELLFENRYQGVLFRGRGTGDLTHINDVEELTPEMAAKFPMFAPGDWMISMRMGSKLIVVDPVTRQIKWYQSGPWLGQHDPDFLENGKILIYNNNDDGTPSGAVFGGGNIMELDPAGGRAITFRYGSKPGQPLYAPSSGKHQELPGGNVLVTEAKAGRVFEFDANGEIVWEFVNRYDDTSSALISEATRYPTSYFTVTDWTCR
jgi:hypothetical protein